MRKSIAIDLDSTLNDLDDKWTEAISKDFGVNLTREDMKSWNADTWKPEGCENIFEPLSRPGWFRNLGVQPHAQEVTKFLSRHFDLYIATAFHPDSVRDKYDWVGEHFPHIDQKNIIFINPKHVLNTHYLIDDGPHNIEAFKQTGVLIDAPWNQNLGNKYKRFTSWLEIEEFFIKELAIKRPVTNLVSPPYAKR